MTKRIFRLSCIALLSATAEAQNWTGYHPRAWSQPRLATAEQVRIYAAPCSLTVTSYPSADSTPVISTNDFWAGIVLDTNAPSVSGTYTAVVSLIARPWITNGNGSVVQALNTYTAQVEAARILTNLSLQAEDVMGFDLWRAMRERRVLFGDADAGDVVFYRRTSANLQAFKSWFLQIGRYAAPTLSEDQGELLIDWDMASTNLTSLLALFYAPVSNWLDTAGLPTNWLDYTPERFVPDDSPRSGHIVTTQLWSATGIVTRVETNGSVAVGRRVSDYWFRPATNLIRLMTAAWSHTTYEVLEKRQQRHGLFAEPLAETPAQAINLAEAAEPSQDATPPNQYIQIYPGLGGDGPWVGPYKYSVVEGIFGSYGARRDVERGRFIATNSAAVPAQLVQYVAYGPDGTNEVGTAAGVEFHAGGDEVTPLPYRWTYTSALTNSGGVMTIPVGDPDMGWPEWTTRAEGSSETLVGWRGYFTRGTIGITRYRFDYR